MRSPSFSSLSRAVFTTAVVMIMMTPYFFQGESQADDNNPRPMSPSFVLALNVTNTLSVDRPDEVLQLNLTLPDMEINDPLNFTVRKQSDNSEVPSGPLNSTIELYPSGYIHRMRVAFQDDFFAGERKGYFVVTGNRTAFNGDMSWSYSYPELFVYDGNATDLRTYRITVDHSTNFYTTGVRVYYNRTTWPYEAQSGILIRVAGDQLDVDQDIIQMGWGSPDSMIVDVNNVMVSVHLLYLHPYAFHWGSSIMQFRDVDHMQADVTINFYNNRSMVDAYVSKKLNDKLYNHNGFIMETALLVAGDGNYEYIFGTPEHARNWVNTTSLNWAWDEGKLVGLDIGNRSAPTAGDLDDDGDLDLIVGSVSGNLTGFRNTGGPMNPLYTLDQTLAPSGGPWDSCTSPDLADLDADGDIDLVVGLESGIIIAFRNTGTPSTPVWSRDDSLVDGANHTDGVPNAAPELADLDEDGDFDFLVGRLDGTFLFFRNTGSNVSPAWTRDDAQFSYLNSGSTLKPGTNSTPEIADINRDGKIDIVFGTGYTTFGSLVYFENEGNNSEPKFTKLYPAMFNNVRGGVYWTRDYSVPEFEDFDGDGLEDLILGISDGTMQYWHNNGYSAPERHTNTFEPLENGSWRIYYDQDGNDGQFVIRNYTSDFYGWYVVSNPDTNQAIFRYVPDFSRYVYKDRYSGEMYPWAGGNTSYYPFMPYEDGRVTRGILITRASRDATVGGYGYGATFLSQTGTAGGYIKCPMAARDHRSREVLIMELPYDNSAALYDQIAETMATPLWIEAPADLTLKTNDITTDPTDPARNMDVTIAANVWNVGFNDSADVAVEFYNGDPTSGGVPIGAPQVIPLVPAGGMATASVVWNTTGVIGKKDIFAVIDGSSAIQELDEDNNIASREFTFTMGRREWSEEILVSQSRYNDMDPVLTRDALNRIWIAWHDMADKEDYNIHVTNFDGVSWGKVETVVDGYKHTGTPALAADRNGDVWLVFSSNLIEYNEYIRTRHAIYYWSCKFDIYVTRHSLDGWEAPYRITRAVEFNDSDQAPQAVFTPDGKLWTSFRHTHFELYKRGQQIINVPFMGYNISAMSYDGSSWSGEQIVDNSPGSQGYLNGATLAVDHNGTLWAFYEGELGRQWDIFYSKNDGSGWSAPTRLVTDSANDMRPVAAVDSNGHLFLVWESDRTGNHDLFVKYFNGTSWTQDFQLTTDLGNDMRPAISRDGPDRVLVAWENDRFGNKDIFLKVFDGMRWSPDFQVTTDPASDAHAAVVGTPLGGAMIAWESDRNGIGNLDIYVKTVTDWPANFTAPRRGPSDLRAELEGRSYQNVRLMWNLSADDWMFGSVTGYIIRCGDTYDPTGSSYIDVLTVPAGTDIANLSNRGHRDPDNLFCQVVANTTSGRSGPSNQAGAYKIHLTDHHLVSVPLVIANTHSTAVLAPLVNITSNFTYARYFEPYDPMDPWKIFSMIGGKEISSIDNGMGLWIGVSGPDQLTVAGVVPILMQVQLKAGWNLVGYPSLTSRTMAEALAGLPVTRVEAFDASTPPYNLRRLSMTDMMMPGQGYWIHVSSDATWLVRG